MKSYERLPDGSEITYETTPCTIQNCTFKKPMSSKTKAAIATGATLAAFAVFAYGLHTRNLYIIVSPMALAATGLFYKLFYELFETK